MIDTSTTETITTAVWMWVEKIRTERGGVPSNEDSFRLMEIRDMIADALAGRPVKDPNPPEVPALST